MSTVAERVIAERTAQGLPAKVQDRDVLDQVAAILMDAANEQEGGGCDARAS
jgi:hypothetical protein